MPAKKHKDVNSIEFKFDADRVNITNLEAYADAYLLGDDFVQTLIRDTKPGEYGLFVLRRYDGTKETQEKILDEMTDSLKREFGNGLKGWSSSNRVFVVKGLDL